MEVTVRVEVHYCTPPDTVLGDVLRLLRSRTWAAFMARHVGPRLEKVSPVDASALETMDHQWQAAAHRGACSGKPVDCVICMDAQSDDTCSQRPTRNYGAQLPCGHNFHRRCIRSWLELQSTCPICRWQLPKEFAGRFVVRRLHSTVVLPPHVHSWPRSQIALAPVGGHSVRVVVILTLEKAAAAAVPHHLRWPCELTALLMNEASGETFTEVDTSVLNHRIASTRFATMEKPKVSDGVSSSCVAPAETGRKRRCIRRQQRGEVEASKRQRVSSE
ncbi:E3 ubiquitin protein ligase RIE1 [Phytophthora cinnamomi]|uniref:E3 ubiquitin protein ligase RIE1 n=1 Tax=Phytophthora cinnamomi TaxID=4785 RepID=UPI003559AB01|nr:E3 ubiquitin protein ligase RIE1 [Phytophthora cinnamomi]